MTNRSVHPLLPVLLVVGIVGAPLAAQGAVPGSAKTQRGGEAVDVDPLALAAVLLEGGDADRALKVLSGVDEDAKGLDRARLHTLRGLAALQLEKFAEAERDLERAVRLQPAQAPLQLQLARAAFGAEHPRKALRALDAAGPAAEERAGWLALRAESYAALGEKGAALGTLRRGYGRFGEAAFVVREVQLLLDQTLTVEAAERARILVERAIARATTSRGHGPESERALDDALGVIEALRRAGAPERAAELATSLRLGVGEGSGRWAVEPALAEARALVDQGRLLAAAHLYEQLSWQDLDYVVDAAELYRRAGHTRTALLLNTRVPDGEKKVRQRFSLLLEDEALEEAAALEPDLARAGLLERDDDVAYALGWALVETGQLRRADRVLKLIDDPRLFAEATRLRQRIAVCRAGGSSSWAEGCP